MNNKVKNLQILFICNALVWICLAVLWLFRIDKYSGREHIVYFNSGMMLANAFVMLIIAQYITKNNRLIYWFSAIYLLANIFLTMADQFGFSDLLMLLIEAAVLYFLINNKLYYLLSGHKMQTKQL